jgi:hypothetical protein
MLASQKVGQYRGKLSENRSVRLTDEEQAIIVGTLLGDGCLERNGTHVRLRIEHGISQEAYVLWKREKLQNIITGVPMRIRVRHAKSGAYYKSVRISTRSTYILEPFWEAFYRDGKKHVPASISLWLRHPLALAIWLMDDGYKRNDCNAIRLNTDSFTLEEQYLLQDALKVNFSIESTVHRKGKYLNLYIPGASARRLVELVRPYIIPSMIYKITLAP